MISLIICSRSAVINNELSVNIESTVGCPSELIIIDNSENKYSIFEAYNLGISRSKGKYLCFMHDDILLHTNNWGLILLEIFQENEKIGLVGVAGAKIKTKVPSAWWNCPEEEKVMNILQHFNEKKGVKHKWEIGFKNNSNKEEVIAIDGVFMVARKDPRIKFNTTMQGFHNYDLNMSFEYLKYDYKILVTNEILIEHFSNGRMDKAWVNSTFQLHNIYKKILPLKTDNVLINSTDFKNLEFDNGVKFVNHSLNFGFKKNALLTWCCLIIIKPYSLEYSKFLKKLINLLLNRANYIT
jgi:glycosyltransferase involved in cell wall biosynthesis